MCSEWKIFEGHVTNFETLLKRKQPQIEILPFRRQL